MKVAYLTTYYNGEVDGRFGRFHDWLHTLREMDDPPFEFEVVALTASNLDGTLSSRPHGVFGDATDLWGSPLNTVEFGLNAPRAIRDLRHTEFDVVHVLTLDLVAYPVALACSDRAPVVGPDVQGYFPNRRGDRWNQKGFEGRLQRARYHARRGLLRLADDPTLVALSQYHADNVRSLRPDAPVSVIPPGVDSIFSPAVDGPDSTTAGSSDSADSTAERRSESADSSESNRPTRFLYLGDLSEYKGYPLFLDALAALPDDLSWRATVIGSGDGSTDRIYRLGLEDRVSVEGFVPREELPAYYREADFFVMPSVDENGPNTIVESLACGTPVIATDRAGINEYGPDGATIYADRSVESFRDAMTTGHRNRVSYRRVARDHAAEFRAERTVHALSDLYERHLERH